MAEDEEENDSFSFIDAAGDVFGSVAGVSIGVLHNDVAGLFTGALVGSGIAHAFRYGVHLLANRFLTHREKARVGLIIGLAAREINRRLEAGEELRTDGFFHPGVNNRSSGDEIAEAVLIAAQREHEERKLPYMAKLLAFVAFTRGIDAPMANQMVKLASGLSYRQFRILALANRPIRQTLSTPMFYGSTGQSAATLMALLSEMFELYRERLVDYPGTFGQMSRAPTDPRSFPLQNIQLGEHGQYLHLAMGLGEMPDSEFADIISRLTNPPSTQAW